MVLNQTFSLVIYFFSLLIHRILTYCNAQNILGKVQEYYEECSFMAAVKTVDSVYLYTLQSNSNCILATGHNYIAWCIVGH